MDEALFDEKLSRLVSETLAAYRQALGAVGSRDDKKKISWTQLAAIATTVDSQGAEGLRQLIDKHLARNERNQKAYEAQKGTSRPRNPEFWELLNKVVEGDLEALASEHGNRDVVFGLFANRLAIQARYQETLQDRQGKERHR